jgi:hypothetical protein
MLLCKVSGTLARDYLCFLHGVFTLFLFCDHAPDIFTGFLSNPAEERVRVSSAR